MDEENLDIEFIEESLGIECQHDQGRYVDISANVRCVKCDEIIETSMNEFLKEGS